MALLEPLYRVSEICAYRGIENVVICPGSRSAALTLAFVRNKKFRIRVITDERSAAFTALGMAQVSGKPTVLICTSGTAALNFSPAVAEAYFQGIPLLVLTADRPPEWINQHDGQTIFQQNIYGRHIVRSYDFPADYTHPDAVWMMERQTHEAIAYTRQGPVHLNVPVREPFYPAEGEAYDGVFRPLSYLNGTPVLEDSSWKELAEVWNCANNILIAVGQNHEDLDASLAALSEDPRVTILADVISNAGVKNKITAHDIFLGKAHGLTPPDLLITCGKSFISKPFKQFFRKHKPAAHWHVEDGTALTDPLQSITARITVPAGYFLEELERRNTVRPGGTGGELTGKKAWERLEAAAETYLARFLEACAFGELKATALLFQHLRAGDALHLGNSMPVRYANLLGSLLPEGVKVFSNRGTSGIEGVVSTAVGQSLAHEGRVHCIVGDVSFFYDSNALFAARPDNLSIYLIQNGGGNIFRIIEGPGKQEELESCFITAPGRTAEGLCREAGYRYTAVRSEEELRTALKNKEGGCALFEIYVDGVQDSGLFQQLKAGFNL